jgi:hypothetical protein
MGANGATRPESSGRFRLEHREKTEELDSILNWEIGMFAAQSGVKIDRIGAALSLTCALHCLLTPLLVASVSFGTLGWLSSEGTETTLLAATVTLAAVVLVRGWHAHRRLEPIGLFAVALALIGSGRFFVPESIETPMVVAGSVAIALAHLVNARLCPACAVCTVTVGDGSHTG